MSNSVVESRGGEAVVLTSESLTRLDAALEGGVLLPGSKGYDGARSVWNAMVDARPGAIVRCRSTADVVLAVSFARKQNLLVSVRSGGHNIAGKAVASGSFTIDLSQMKRCVVDSARAIATCGPGLNLGELDAATAEHGLATVLGIATDTGMAGVALGGGYGWLAGRYAMTCDNLLAAEVVLANGDAVTVSATENDDLFWGIRGGGGNFGIVTSFEFRLHPVSTVWGGLIVHPRSEAIGFLRFVRDFAASAPDELTLAGSLMCLPDGTPAVAAIVCFCGAEEAADEVLAPLRAYGEPLLDDVAQIPYTEQQAILDEVWPPGDRYYWKTSLIANLSDAAIEVLVAHANKAPNGLCLVALQQLHGAATRVPAAATAFAHRFDHYNFIPLARWTSEAEAESCIAWSRDIWEAMQPHSEEAVYGNDLGDDAGERVSAAYGDNYARLVEIKNAYDPSNFFRLNQNVQPES